METLLLEARFHPPPLPPVLVNRPRLVTRLNESIYYPLSLISAPAGFGKTTLLAVWAQQASVPVIWLQIEPEDRDPARFLAYLKAALARVRPNVVVDQTIQIGSNLENALANLANALYPDSSPFILVLDDLHLIESVEIQDALGFFVEHLPPQMHLIISSRADPHLPLSRMRARSQLLEIRAADLRFTTAETAEFLQKSAGIILSYSDLRGLTSRVEGWAAGLQLLALASLHRSDNQEFIQSFSGSHTYIADYLRDEVLNRQTAEIQKFLLHTSILDELCGPLCDALLERKDSQQILNSLVETNLFLLPIDDQRHWFRYHRLFADLLRHQLLQAEPAIFSKLHKRAADWYLTNEMPREAIQHALQSDAQSWAAELIEEQADETLKNSELATLVEWVRQLPQEIVLARPGLAVSYAWVLLLTGKPLREVYFWLGGIDSNWENASPEAISILAFLALMQGDINRSIDLAQLALTRLDEGVRYFREIAAWVEQLAQINWMAYSERDRTLRNLVEDLQDTGNVMFQAFSICAMAEMQMWQGNLRNARVLYGQVLEMATDSRGKRLPIAGQALLGLGELAREINDLDGAQAYLKDGIELANQWAEFGALDGLVTLANTHYGRGEWAAAKELMLHVRELAHASEATLLDDWMTDIAYVRLRLWQGDPEPARRWAANRNFSGAYQHVENPEIKHRMNKYERLVYARLMMFDNKPEDALLAMEGIQPAMEWRGRKRGVIETIMLRGLAYQQMGSKNLALQEIDAALALAKPAGFFRLFVDEGSEMMRLLYTALSKGLHSEYVGHLLEAFPKPGEALRDEHAQFLIEQLTPRELEVLTLLAQGKTNSEIAVDLVLAESTVKVHARNIYSKLGVNNRVQAAARARELGILSQ